ncbi:hypothetical protein J6590_074718 [Homalodisca vitripennis]|nr:hypothetical protein J6590_074718 [Homalodisca vitripennis]
MYTCSSLTLNGKGCNCPSVAAEPVYKSTIAVDALVTLSPADPGVGLTSHHPTATQLSVRTWRVLWAPPKGSRSLKLRGSCKTPSGAKCVFSVDELTVGRWKIDREVRKAFA